MTEKPTPEQFDDACHEFRQVIVSALSDFIAYLKEREPAIVVGNGYPDERLYRAYIEWAASRGLDVTDFAAEKWVLLIIQGGGNAGDINDANTK